MEHLDEILGIVLPIFVYWVYAGFYEFIGSLESFQKYKIQSMEHGNTKNKVPKRQAIKGALMSQAFQGFLVLLTYLVPRGGSSSKEATSILVLARQFVVAAVVLDTHMYFMHRMLHWNKFLFRHLHSHHHQIVAPTAFTTHYSNPLEIVVLDTLGGIIGFFVSGMSHRASIVFFTFGTIKAVDDHCGMRLPWNPLHYLFPNNTMFHDIHHETNGHKYNYGQPFFVMWDKLMGTYMPYSREQRPDGSYKPRPAAVKR